MHLLIKWVHPITAGCHRTLQKVLQNATKMAADCNQKPRNAAGQQKP